MGADAVGSGLDGEQAIYGDDEWTGWELQGAAAVRQGKWKGVFMSSSGQGKGRWELYDLETDPGERIDLAEKMPEKMTEVVAFWERYCAETGTMWGEERFVGEHENMPFGRVLPGSLGGDPIEDAKGWMLDSVNQGEVLKGTELNG